MKRTPQDRRTSSDPTPYTDEGLSVSPRWFLEPLLDFFVYGVPLPKGSPSIHVNRATRKAFVREDEKTVAWGELVRARARAEVLTKRVRVRCGIQPGERWVPLDEPVSLELVFWLPPRKADKVPPAGGRLLVGRERAAVKPDLDKLVRTIGDALEGVVYVGDSRVTDVLARKRRAIAAGRRAIPGVGVLIRVYRGAL